MKIDQFFGGDSCSGDVKALRKLLDAHRVVGVDFHGEDSASVTLVWPAIKDDACAPWIISEKVVGLARFKAILRTLFIETRSIKVLHYVGDVAQWMAAHGLAKAVSAVRNTVDLQLFYERVVDPNERYASLAKILEQQEKTPQEMYRGMLSNHFLRSATEDPRTKDDTKTPSTGNAAALAHTLLQPSVQRAHLCLFCFDRVVAMLCLNANGQDPRITVAKLLELTSRRVLFSSTCPRGYARIWFDRTAGYLARSAECLGDAAHLAAEVPSSKVLCDIEPLLALLPARLYDSIMAIDKFEERIATICLDVGRKPIVYIDADDGLQRVELCKKPKGYIVSTVLFGFKQSKDDNLTREELHGIIAMLGGEGKIDSSNRACVDSQLHRISVVRTKATRITGLTIRVGRHLQFGSNMLLDLLRSPAHRRKSILIVGGIGSGKTCLLRDLARCISEWECGENVCVVDSSNQIGGDGSLPHPSSGLARRMMVQSLHQQAQVILECVQNHAVETLLVDEVGSPGDIDAVAYAKRHCQRVIAGVSHSDLKSLVEDYELNALVGCVDAGKSPFPLFDEAAAKKQRKKKPLFDVVVELDDKRRGLCRIVWNSAKAVDDTLRGQNYSYEARMQHTDVHGVLALPPACSHAPSPSPSAPSW